MSDIARPITWDATLIQQHAVALLGLAYWPARTAPGEEGRS